jgi:hypothetical protein
MEVLIVLIALAAVGFAAYWMLNIREGQNIFDLNKDGQVSKADAEVVVEKAKKNVRKAVNKTANKVADKTKAPAKTKTAAKPKSKTK